ncbi:retrovirus-related pol polyprotein from transposon TNT 1-94 [Tanacetum coccineum]|uniref:Retrovirus-related pol polyprotein from transposon TNT 1-94 n=1 Tax=Tanacetum coccineum TaxID=301880 RepID=A0ABQ5I7M0_9ASTR
MAAVEVPQTLEYRGGQLNAAPVLEVENFTNWKKRFMCHIIGIEPQFVNIISNGPFIPMAAGQRKPERQWTADERKAANLDQRLKSLIIYKALMNELVNDGIKLSKLEINIGFINGLPNKWLSFYLSLRNTNHVKDSELASIFGKLKHEENLIDSIYENEKSKSLVSATPLSTAFFSTFIVQDFQDSPDDEEDTRSSHEYLNDLEEEYQTRALLAKFKRFFKKGTQRFSNAKATDQTECHKCGKNGHFVRDCWSKTLVPLYQSPFQPKLLHSSKHKPESRHTKDFEVKYNKIKAKLALLSSNASAPSSSSYKNKVKALMALTDKERVSVGNKNANNGEWVKISIEKHVNTEILKENQNLRNQLKELSSITEAWLNSSSKVNKCINEQIPTQKGKILGIDQLTKDTSSSGPKDPVFVKSSADNSEVSITSSNKPKLSKTEDSTLSNHDTGKLMNLQSVAPPSSTGEADTCDHADFMSSMDINQYHTSQSESSSRSRPYRPAMPFPSCIQCGYNDHHSDDCVYYPICEICKSYDHDTHGHNRIISLRKGIKPKNPQHITKNCETCGSNVHTTSDHNNIVWFRKREALQAKKVESFKASKTESSSALRSKTPTKSIYQSLPAQIWDVPGPEGMYVKNFTQWSKGYGYVNTPIMPPNMLGPDLNGKAVNESQIEIKYHTLKRDNEFLHPTQYQLTDIFTKPLDEPTFKRFIVELGMLNIDSKPEASVLTEEN